MSDTRRYGDDPPPPPGQITQSMAEQAVLALRNNVRASTDAYIGMSSNLSEFTADTVYYQSLADQAFLVMTSQDYQMYKDAMNMASGIINNQVRTVAVLAPLSLAAARLSATQAEIEFAQNDWAAAYNTTITGNTNRVNADDEISITQGYLITVHTYNTTARTLLMAAGLLMP